MSSNTVSRVQALASTIEDFIDDRELSAGDRVTTIAELREETGFAKQTITETFRLLAERGVIEIRPGRGGGAFVAANNPVVRLRRTLLTVPNNATTVADTIAVRESLEELICTDAAQARSTADIADLRKILHRMQRAIDSSRQFMAANWALHERLALIGPNRVARAIYIGTLGYIVEQTTSIEAAAEDPPEYLRQRFEVHRELVEAIVASDTERTKRAVHAHRRSAESAAPVLHPGA